MIHKICKDLQVFAGTCKDSLGFTGIYQIHLDLQRFAKILKDYNWDLRLVDPRITCWSEPY